MNARAVLERLEREADEAQADLDDAASRYRALVEHREEHVDETISPVLDRYYNSGGNAALATMINFTLAEFEAAFAIVDEAITREFTTGRGRRPAASPKDAFFMALVVLKHANTWDKHGVDFQYQGPTLERLMHRVFGTIEPLLYAALVRPVTMTAQQERGAIFRNYPVALYATDVKFQPSFRPSGRFSEQRRYYSGKHNLYGLKFECSVALPGVAVDVSDHATGSVSDFTIFSERIHKHHAMLAKSDAETRQQDQAEGHELRGSEWAVLADKGYQGAQQIVRAIIPKRRPRGGVLDAADLERNRRVSSDRVLVENYFGRMCSLWRIMSHTFKWGEDKYDQVVRICTALTNHHVNYMPLRAPDGAHYQQVLARYYSMAETQRTNRARTQRNYRDRRNRRMEREAAEAGTVNPYARRTQRRGEGSPDSSQPYTPPHGQLFGFSQ